MSSSPFRLWLAAAVVFPAACGRTHRQGGPETSPAASSRHEEPDRTAEVVKARLAAAGPGAPAGDSRSQETWAAVRRLYERNDYRPVWVVDGKPRREIQVFRDAVQAAAADGLDPAAYDLRPADALLTTDAGGAIKKKGPLEPVVDADVRLSQAFLTFARDLAQGRVAPGQVDEHWFGQQRKDDLAEVLKVSLDSGQLGQALDGLKAQHPQYSALKKALARYREAAAHGGWEPVPAGLSLRPGKADPAVAALRAHLIATGDLPAEAAPAVAPAPGPVAPSSASAAPPASPVFDTALQDALKRFQRRHGLAAGGRLDRDTLAALNVPVEDRIRQIELNLERWRWLPETLGERYVLVNIPTFHLTAVDHGQVELQMRVVTGKQDSPTPIFSDEMTTIVFSPYWNVPYDIARNETMPAAMRDPGYLGRNNLEVVRGGRVLDPWSVDWSRPGNVQFRQRPGPRNALGNVKFLFPNQFDVYLHDTPADALFSRVERDYSHGCVRLEKPFEMAEWVLKDRPEWTPEKIKAAMDGGREQHVALKQHIPVYIVYQTVWVDDDGSVEFRDDVYGHDAQQQKVLPAPPLPGIQVAEQGSHSRAALAGAEVRHVADAR
jgi:murein L,D-transpeptidase YcbB/YkuD